MKEFRDLDALHRVLTSVDGWPEDVRRSNFATALVTTLEFSESVAASYTSVVLGTNQPGYAARVHRYGREVIGRWGRGDHKGSAGNLIVTKQWSWTFGEDLVYQYTYEGYQGYTNPFGGGYTVPSSEVQRGVWAPGDYRGDDGTLAIVIIPYGGRPRRLRHRWVDSEPPHDACWIDSDRYARLD